MAEIAVKELAIAKSTLDEHKAEDILVVDVSETSPFASYVVIATCLNPRALGAMKDILEEEFLKAAVEVPVKEGEADSGWVIVQGGDVIVHLFLEGNRRQVNLEGLLALIADKHKKN